MLLHDADYSRYSGQVQDVRECDLFFGLEVRHVATEPPRSEQPRWPSNVFGEPALIAELLAEAKPLPEAPREDPKVDLCGYRGEAWQTRSNP